MELKEFIEGALTQIIDGIKACQKAGESLDAVVNPSGIKYQEGIGFITVIDNVERPVKNVEFEVGLTTSEKDGVKGGISVFFSGVGIGGQKNSELGTAATTSLKFSIPVAFPAVVSQKPKPKVMTCGPI